MAEVLISDDAAARLSQLIADRDSEEGLRVHVEHRCHCGGLKYGMALGKAQSGDKHVAVSGVTVYVAPEVEDEPGAAEIDFQTSQLGSGFTLANSEHACGPMAHD